MKKGGIWKCENPYDTNIKNICKRQKLPNRLYFQNRNDCLDFCLTEKRNKFNILIIGENQRIGLNSLDILINKAKNKEINLFIEARYKIKDTYKLCDSSYDNIHFLELHTLSTTNGVEFKINNDNIYLDNIINSKYTFNIKN